MGGSGDGWSREGKCRKRCGNSIPSATRLRGRRLSREAGVFGCEVGVVACEENPVKRRNLPLRKENNAQTAATSTSIASGDRRVSSDVSLVARRRLTFVSWSSTAKRRKDTRKESAFPRACFKARFEQSAPSSPSGSCFTVRLLKSCAGRGDRGRRGAGRDDGEVWRGRRSGGAACARAVDVASAGENTRKRADCKRMHA